MANRTKPEQIDISKLHKDCVDILREKQWLVFLEKFNGHNELTTREFTYSFTREGEPQYGTYPLEFQRI